MARSDDYAGSQPSPTALHRLQEYVVHTVKAVLCVACCSGFFVLLLTYGPPTMRVSLSPPPTRPYEIVTAVLGVALSGGIALLLTIVVVILVVIGLNWHQNQSQSRSQNRRNDDSEGTDPSPDAPDVEEEPYA